MLSASRPSREDSENVSLVSREAPIPGNYTDEGGPAGGGGGGGGGRTVRIGSSEEIEDDLREMDYVETDVSVLSQFHEDALTQAGFGAFQRTLFFVAGLGLAADAIEIYVIAYVIPSAEQELCMEDEHKGWLAAISFLGMMIGGLVWGSLADRLGRRRTLLSALSTNAIFGVITAFMPTYGLIMITRLCSGIGVGGSLPIVFTYFSEFLVKKHRGRHLSWLLSFWAFGGVFVAIMAWGIIPRTGSGIMGSEGPHFSSWRVFLLVCSMPALASTIGLIFMPESPRFLLEVGRDVEAMYVYQKIFKSNNARKPGTEYQLSELELPVRRHSVSYPSGGHRSLITECLNAMESFWSSIIQIMLPPYTKVTFVLLAVWMTTAFGFYGISIWFPEYIKRIESDSYTSKTVTEANLTLSDLQFNSSIENRLFVRCQLTDVVFAHLILNHCVFEDCFFSNVSFLDVRSSRTFFRQSTFRGVRFVDTDFYDYRFQDCDLDNATTFINTKAGCELDFDLNYQLSEVFLENMVAQLAILPGNFLSSYVLDRLGRVRTMGCSLFLSGVSIFGIWFLQTKPSVVAFEAIFNFITISGWNAVDVITTESYPATLRSTGYGFLSAISRLAAIMGNLTFGHFLGVSKTIPILTTAAVLVIGALFSLKLRETKDMLM